MQRPHYTEDIINHFTTYRLILIMLGKEHATFAVPSVTQTLNFTTVCSFSFCPLSESLERRGKVRLELPSTLLALHASQDGVVVVVSFLRCCCFFPLFLYFFCFVCVFVVVVIELVLFLVYRL